MANDWTDLTDGTLQVPINLDEFGLLVLSSFTPATNVLLDGTRQDFLNHCNDWTSNSNSLGFFGDEQSTFASWTQAFAAISCGATTWTVYCFEQ